MDMLNCDRHGKPSGAARKPLDHTFLINYELTDYLRSILLENPDLSNLFGVELKQIQMLQDDTELYRLLAGTPFFVLTPLLQEPADWRALLEGGFPTKHVDGLRNLGSRFGPDEQRYACSQNRLYLLLMQEVLDRSSLAAPILGISIELADYLRTIPSYELNRAVSTLPCPMFRWRITSPAFFIEYETRRIPMPAIAHYFMQHSPARLPMTDASSSAPHPRFDRARVDTYGAMLARIGCRASTITSVLKTSPSRAREIYESTNGVASPTGQSPTTLNPLFTSASARIHSTAFTWLYRLGIVEHACEPLALIDAYSVAKQVFGTALQLSADRAALLARVIGHANKTVTMAPCRTCKTHYLVNAVELSTSYECPCCAGTLRHHKSLGRKK